MVETTVRGMIDAPPSRGLFCLVVLLLPLPVSAQIPAGDFRNLEVLPADIDRKALVDQMKQFTQALGVRCQHCHVGKEGAPLSSFDFASDEMETKEIARTMMRMTTEINQGFLAKLRGGTVQVQCVTCHRGAPQPKLLEEVLTEALDSGGSKAMIARYRELRKETFGSAMFDFRPDSLNRLARNLAVGGRLVEAKEILELNLEFYPEDVSTLLLHGEVLLKSGAKDAAAESFRKVLAIEPDNSAARRRLGS